MRTKEEYIDALENLLDALERMHPTMHVSERVRSAYNEGRRILPKSVNSVSAEDKADGPRKGPRKVA